MDSIKYKCGKCSNYIRYGQKYCDNCGEEVNWPNEDGADKSPEESPKDGDMEEKCQYFSEGQIRAMRSKAIAAMLLWLFVVIGGIVATVSSYEAAVKSSTNNTYVVFWGAIVFGFINFFKNMIISCDPEGYLEKRYNKNKKRK